MLRCELAGWRRKMAFLGVAESARGGGGELWLPRLSRGFWQVAGCSVKVREGLNWAVECCGGSLQIWLISDRSGGKCLWCRVRAVVGGWIEGWEVWKGGALVSCWEELGRVLWSVELGLLREGGDGFCGEGSGVWARFVSRLGVECGEFGCWMFR